MHPADIAKIRGQIEALQSQAEAMAEEQPLAAERLRGTLGPLYQAIIPYCWSCGATLTPVDPADHLCLGCTGDLPLSFPY